MKRLLAVYLMCLPLLATADVVVPIDTVRSHVNIRISQDANSEIVGRLAQGEFLQLVDSTEDWHEVEIAGGATGFISAGWVNVLDEPPEVIEEVSVAEASNDDSSDQSDDQSSDKSSDEPSDNADADAADDSAVVASPVEADVLADTDSVVVEDPAESLDAATIATPDIAVTEEASSYTEERVVEGGDAAVDADPESAVEQVAADAREPLAEELTTDVGDEEMPASADDDVNSAVPASEQIANEQAQDEQPQSTAANLVGLRGETGPPGPPGAANIDGTVGFLTRFTAPTTGGSSLIFDDGNNIGIGTTEPVQRLEVNGNIQIHEQNSSVAGLMITQSAGETGYIMHNRASTLTIGAGSIDRITIDRDGNVGFGVAQPSHPIEMASGAHVTSGGVWTNSSSRARKENIEALSLTDAVATLRALEPVHFSYKNDHLDRYIGFIAEDVPDMVSTHDRQGLSSMDIVAVLTKVVQDQQKKIAELEARLDQL